MSTGSELITLIGSRQNLDDYQKKHWSGSFAEYLDILQHDPKVTRTALQNAASIASLMLTTEAMVSEIPEGNSAPSMNPMGHGGGGMDY